MLYAGEHARDQGLEAMGTKIGEAIEGSRHGSELTDLQPDPSAPVSSAHVQG